MILGIDEAGRGPILGPMVLAGVLLTPGAASSLGRAGVADSKRFGAGAAAHASRQALAEHVRALASATWVEVVDVEEIDRYTARKALNVLERERARAIIAAIGAPARRILCDGARLFSPLSAEDPRIEAKDRAEDAHVAVAAASVLAKVRRDELFACTARRYAATLGPVGGMGYLNEATRRFLRAYHARHGELPPEARRSFASNLLAELAPAAAVDAPSVSDAAQPTLPGLAAPSPRRERR